jgi:hypothetical protein
LIQCLGSTSKAYGKPNRGLLLHSTLLVTEAGKPLGISSQQCWARTAREESPQERARRYYTASIEEKESYKWIKGLTDTIPLIPSETQLVMLGDREADIFDFLWTAALQGTFFVVRCRQLNRKFICPETGKTNIKKGLQQLSETKEIVIQVPCKETRKERTARLEVQYMTGLIPIRSGSLYGVSEKKRTISDKVALSVVSVREHTPPQGKEGLEWVLLTNVFVKNFEEAIERIRWYKLRWTIEEYFRILKSGCKIESSRLSTKERLEN